MKHIGCNILNQPVYVMKWMLGKGKLISHMGYANNRVTIGTLVRIEIKFSERCEVTLFIFIFCKAIFLSCLQFLCIRLMYECLFLGYKRLVYLI